MKELEELVRDVLDQENVLLVELVVKNVHRNPLVQVFADTEKGITLEELAAVSRKLAAAIDERGILPGGYRLDLSSPGVDRPLAFPWQYRRNIGRELDVAFEREGIVETMRGLLTAADEERILVQAGNGETTIPLADIRRALVRARL